MLLLPFIVIWRHLLGVTKIRLSLEVCEDPNWLQAVTPEVLTLLPCFSPEAMEISSHQLTGIDFVPEVKCGKI